MPALERSRGPERADVSAAGAGEERGDDVGGVPVERDSGAVVAHGGARIDVAGGLLDVAERHASIERRGDERVTERVWSDARGYPCPSGDAAHDPPGGVSVDPCPVAPTNSSSRVASVARQRHGTTVRWPPETRSHITGAPVVPSSWRTTPAPELRRSVAPSVWTVVAWTVLLVRGDQSRRGPSITARDDVA
jgi:hypothetical protein